MNQSNGNNLLERWKEECYWPSSPLNIKRTLDRTDVEQVYKVLIGFFGLEHFNPTTQNSNCPTTIQNSNVPVPFPCSMFLLCVEYRACPVKNANCFPCYLFQLQ